MPIYSCVFDIGQNNSWKNREMFLAWMTGKKLEFGKFILRERFFYSALDAESERIVQNALDKLIKGNQYIFFTLP